MANSTTITKTPAGVDLSHKTIPRGDKGARLSVFEVARIAAAGRLQPEVRSWAIEKLVEAGGPHDQASQASVILNAVHREKLFVRDPVDAEFIAGPECTLGTCGELHFQGGDCDDLTVAFLAAVLSIGIDAAAVGQSMYEDQKLDHVIAAVWDGQSWLYADPSEKQLMLGEKLDSTREVWVSIPGLEPVCDGTDCETKMASRSPNSAFWPGGGTEGDYIGVGSAAREGEVSDGTDDSQAPWWAPGIVGFVAGALVVGVVSLISHSPNQKTKKDQVIK